MDEIEGGKPAAKKPSPIVTIAAIGVLTLLAGGGGWMLGGMIAPPPENAAAAAVEPAGEEDGGKKKKDEGLPRVATEANGIVQLEAITTNLAYPSENWIRLEVALQFNGAPDVTLSEQIHQDIAGYLKTVSLQQIQGPRGFQYLKDDIQERVDLRSEGRVTNVIFRTFVIQ
ncbi:flagellar basal body-associated FliL family protein [Pararhizobium antarcticum]|uniref:Flagellar protein FliL n=1 Tax=Pararhizobium antarcticum TaxID=1798805 RepID=A0A657LRJ9_9HYPH|nr:flagellar basal body-associated FliL family protein [Pararhizobium antarcticum]OJF94286.1 flagellar basal body protein FliL [Rhizobium sp. 58]OJF96312.1 flagellar basal body protein FliL [Pararhizobium antarcticum]